MTYLKKAAEFVREHGPQAISREALCAHLGVPPGSFTYVTGMAYNEFIIALARTMPISTDPLGQGRIHPELRKRQILACAVELSKEHGYARITRKQVAARAGTSEPNVARLYSMPALREAVIRHALEHRIASIVAQAKAANDPLVAD